MMFAHDTRRAEDAVKAARRRGLPIPDEIPAVADMVTVAVKAAHMQAPARPTRDDIPATPEELAAAIEERAHAQRIAASHREIGTDYLEPLARRYNQLVRDQVPGWILALQPEFNALVKQLRPLARKLPHSLDKNHLDWNDPRVTTPWARIEGIALQLDQVVRDRTDMVKASDLAGEHVVDRELYAVAKLPAPTVEAVVQHQMRTHIGPEMRQWKDLRQDPVRRWVHLARSEHLTIELATPDEVRQRAVVRDQWYEGIAARGMAPVPTAKSIKAIETALRG
ncbi:hypothetical protein AB0K87_14440 [Streptomyces sp. NPDC053705]|uniref:hypothetical protein n=1 Tax=Streptomyces sp. NPDC053705 TaxID=3156668 RepID=UPI00342AF8F1